MWVRYWGFLLRRGFEPRGNSVGCSNVPIPKGQRAKERLHDDLQSSVNTQEPLCFPEAFSLVKMPYCKYVVRESRKPDIYALETATF